MGEIAKKINKNKNTQEEGRRILEIAKKLNKNKIPKGNKQNKKCEGYGHEIQATANKRSTKITKLQQWRDENY